MRLTLNRLALLQKRGDAPEIRVDGSVDKRTERKQSTAIRILRFIARRLEERGLPRTNLLARCITLYSLHDAMRVALLSRRLRFCVNIFDTILRSFHLQFRVTTRVYVQIS